MIPYSNMMYYGLKLWSQNPSYLFDEAIALQQKGMANFLELYIVPDSFDESQFEKLKHIPITLHATHESHGFNIAQDNTQNQRILEEVFRYALRQMQNICVERDLGFLPHI